MAAIVVLTAFLYVIFLFNTSHAESLGSTHKFNKSVQTAVEHERKLVKRAPNGFMGMRGKKYYQEELVNNWQGINPIEQDYVEDVTDIYENGNRFKKTPNAFYDVRGKKYTKADELNRMSHLIQKLEGENFRDALFQEFLDHLVGNGMDSNEILAKRAPTGFTGMRGKRPELQIDNSDNASAAAAASAVATNTDETEYMSKRAPINAFLGVRGKKDVSHQNYKRAAATQVGQQKAFETRGKKQRFIDFSNKFVAVRGKKNYNGDNLAANNFNKVYNGVSYLLNYPSFDAGAVYASVKRAPNGFLGMRGKRADSIMALMK